MTEETKKSWYREIEFVNDLIYRLRDWWQYERPRLVRCIQCNRLLGIRCDDDAYFCSEDCETLYSSWLCVCDHWVEHWWHCDCCGYQPPWGCDCSECTDREREEFGMDDAEWLGMWEAYPGDLLESHEMAEMAEMPEMPEMPECATCSWHDHNGCNWHLGEGTADGAKCVPLGSVPNLEEDDD